MRDDDERSQMSNDPLSFLDASDAEEVAPAAEAVVEPVKVENPEPAQSTAPAPAQPRDEKGRFVPISALLDERDKRKAMEERVRQYESQQIPEEPPHYPADPRELFGYVEDMIEERLFDATLNQSEAIARRNHGDDIVNEAQAAYRQAMDANPHLFAELRGQADPYEHVVRWHKQQKAFSEIGKDPDAWAEAQRQRIREELLAELQGRPVSSAASASSHTSTPPRSVVGKPAAAKVDSNLAHIGPGSAFDDAFR